jgi:hypothetical protein
MKLSAFPRRKVPGTDPSECCGRIKKGRTARISVHRIGPRYSRSSERHARNAGVEAHDSAYLRGPEYLKRIPKGAHRLSSHRPGPHSSVAFNPGRCKPTLLATAPEQSHAGLPKGHVFSHSKIEFLFPSVSIVCPLRRLRGPSPDATVESGSGRAQAGRNQVLMLASMRCFTVVSNSRRP